MDDKQKSRKYFDGHSSTFVNRNGYWNYDYRLTSRILKKRNVKKLVDIGCGNGAFLGMFHKLSPGTKLAGLDISHEMVLRSRVSLAKETGINILLPYYPLVFEGSTLTDVYEMLYELYKKTLRKCRPENIWEGMTGGEKVPEYMKYLQLGNYYGLSDVYMSFGGDEVFLAGADSIRRRLEEFGTHVTVEIGEGMYHSYAMMPLVEDAQEGYRHFVEYIKE
jgi:SAM-dependent methyltransferase